MDRKTKILIIEDDSVLVKAYLAALTHRGYNVIHATDGSEGIQKTIREYPDVVLLDLRLPKKNGFEVLETIKKRKESKELPIIVLSNDDLPLHFERALKLGASNYLLKAHLSIEELNQEIQKYA